ncbi:hypothetical protein OQA88_11401 [Cercophora sp. LCS_1]
MVNMSFLQKLKVPHLAVRGIQGFFALVILGLSAYVAHWYNTDTLTASPSQINIMIFSGVWSIISILQMEVVSKFLPRLAHPWAFLAIEFINVVLWFGSSISLALFLSRLLFCRGSVCAAAQADVVFSFVMLGAWISTFVPLTFEMCKNGFRRRASGSAPKMSGAAGMKEVA